MSVIHASLFAKGPRIELGQLVKLRHLAATLQLMPESRSRSLHSGGYASVFRGRGMEFDEVRHYQPGDDIRSIDWRVTARTSRTHTKIYREERERPVMLMVDQRLPLFFGSQVTYKSVMAAQLAALLAWAGLQQNDKVGGIVFNEFDQLEIKPQRHRHAVLALLRTLSEYNQRLFTLVDRKVETGSIISLNDILERLRRIVRPGSAVFLVSDFSGYNEQSERLLFLLKRHCDIHALMIADPLERQLPAKGLYYVTDGDSSLRVNVADRGLVQAYTSAFDKRQNQLHESFSKLGLPLQTVWTNDDPQMALQKPLRQTP